MKLEARVRRLALAGAVSLAASVYPALAQQTPAPAQPQSESPQDLIPEVVITAQRRKENLQTTPLAVTALSAHALDERGVTSLAGVAQASTSINFTPYPSSSSILTLYMRGQGVADPNQITQDGSVGLYEDGFYIARPQAEIFDLVDVRRVEILRGPQGTLYGRNTTGGAINLISEKPTGELDFAATLDGGSRDYARARGVIDLPAIAGGLSSRIVVLYHNLAGNVHNSGGEDYNREGQRGVRAALRWDSGGPFRADYFYENGETDSTPIYYQDPALAAKVPGYPATDGLASRTWEPLALPLSVTKFNADGLTLSWRPNRSTVVKSLTGYRGLDSRFTQNYAGTVTTDPIFNFISLPTPTPGVSVVEGLVNSTTADVVQSNELTQEFQLIGTLGARFNYVAGIYYYQEHANHAETTLAALPDLTLQVTGVPFPIPSPTATIGDRYVKAAARSRAIYAQGTFRITRALSLTLGGRYTWDERSAVRDLENFTNGILVPPADTFASAHNDLKFGKFTPAGTLSLAITPDLYTYLRIATGYKAGGSSEADSPGEFSLTFRPEDVSSYELGLKSYWLDRRVRANLALFDSDFTNMQIGFQVDPADLAVVLTQNAGKARVDGAEFELLFAPSKDLELGLNYSYLHSSIDEVTALAGTIFDPAVNPASPYRVGENIAPLFRLPYAPTSILGANLDWTLAHAASGSLELALNYRFQGRQYDTAATGPAVPGAAQFYSIAPYGVLDGRLTWNFAVSDPRTLRLSLWGKNITNEQYPLHVIGQGAAPLVSFVPGVPPTGYTYQAVAWAPRIMVGVELQCGF